MSAYKKAIAEARSLYESSSDEVRAAIDQIFPYEFGENYKPMPERSRQEYPEDYYTDPGTGELEDRNEDQRFAYARGFTHGVEASLANGWRPSEAQMEALYDAIGRFDSDAEGTQTLQSLFDDLRKLYHDGNNTQA